MFQAKKRGYEAYPPPGDGSGRKDINARERAAYIKGYEEAWASLHSLTEEEARRLCGGFFFNVKHSMRDFNAQLENVVMEWIMRHCVRQEHDVEFLPSIQAFVARGADGLKLIAVNEDGGWCAEQLDGRRFCDCAALGLPEKLFPDLGYEGLVEVELCFRVVNSHKDLQQ